MGYPFFVLFLVVILVVLFLEGIWSFLIILILTSVGARRRYGCRPAGSAGREAGIRHTGREDRQGL